jgi:hypothetical protein
MPTALTLVTDMTLSAGLVAAPPADLEHNWSRLTECPKKGPEVEIKLSYHNTPGLL